MKKNLPILAVIALGGSLLAGCNSQSKVATPTPFEKEVVSSVLLADTGAQTRFVQAARRQSKNPIDFDPNNVTASLASFDALSLDSYTVETKSLTSDKSDYTHEDEVIYTLPDGTKESVYLYYGEPKEQTIVNSTSGEDTDEVEEKELHGAGWRSGGFAGMLQGSLQFDDYDEEGATIVASWKNGLAVVGSTEYHFYSEHLTVTEIEDSNEKEVSNFSSFGLFNGSSFLAVEQIDVVDGTEKETAYAYTAFQNASFERLLITEEDNDVRLAYKTPLQKMVINRFVEDGKTLYSLHVKIFGSMKLSGVYEKVTTKDANGNEVVSYQLYDKTAKNVPNED